MRVVAHTWINHRHTHTLTRTNESCHTFERGNFTWDVTHSRVWRNPDACVTYHIHVCYTTLFHVSRGVFVCVTWLIEVFICFICVSWLIRLCNDWFICATWPIHTCHVTYSCVWHDILRCPYDSCVWLNSFVCVIWLNHMCDMTRSCVNWLIRWYGLDELCPTHKHMDSIIRFICVDWIIHPYVCGTWLIRLFVCVT